MKVQLTREQIDALKAAAVRVEESGPISDMLMSLWCDVLDAITEESPTPDRDGFDTGPLRWEADGRGYYVWTSPTTVRWVADSDTQAWVYFARLCQQACDSDGPSRSIVATWHAVVERDVSEPPDSNRTVWLRLSGGGWRIGWYEPDIRKWFRYWGNAPASEVDGVTGWSEAPTPRGGGE